MDTSSTLKFYTSSIIDRCKLAYEGVVAELIREYKRQGLIDYITSMFDNFLEEVVKSRGMDVQVGVGNGSSTFRVFPVLSHFITDNMQAVELCSVNDHHCRMCYGITGKDFGYYRIGHEKCRIRDVAQHMEVLSNFSKYEIVRIKNIAEGHNALSLSAEDRANLKKYTKLHTSLGCVANENPIFNLSSCFHDVPGKRAYTLAGVVEKLLAIIVYSEGMTYLMLCLIDCIFVLSLWS